MSDAATNRFHQRLFEKDPSTRLPFAGDIESQRQNLMRMITTAVNGLNDLDRLVSVMKDLGQRHGGHGVQEMLYRSFVSALLRTLEQELGGEFTEDARNAWTEMYVLLAGVMRDGQDA